MGKTKNVLIFMIIFSLLLNTSCASLIVDRNLGDDERAVKEERVNNGAIWGGLIGFLAGLFAFDGAPYGVRDPNYGIKLL